MGYYFLGFGILVCGFALWAIFNNLKLLLAGTRVQGVIVGVDEQLRRGDSQHKKIYYHPVIEFISEDGNPFQFTFGTGSTHHRPEVGKSVTVIYHRGEARQSNAELLHRAVGRAAGGQYPRRRLRLWRSKDCVLWRIVDVFRQKNAVNRSTHSRGN